LANVTNLGVSYEVAVSEIKRAKTIEDLIALSPETESDKLRDIVEASEENVFEQTKGLGVNEYHYLVKEYKEISRRYYMEAGSAVTKTFNKFLPIVEGAALKIVKEDRSGTFMGADAEGDRQFLMRPITPDSVAVAEGNREQSTGGTGRINNFPIDAFTPATNKAEDQQELVILGLLITTDPSVVISYIDEIDDTIGERPEVDVINSAGMSDTQFVPYESAVYIQNSDTYNSDLIAAENASTDIWPVGVDIITEAQVGP